LFSVFCFLFSVKEKINLLQPFLLFWEQAEAWGPPPGSLHGMPY